MIQEMKLEYLKNTSEHSINKMSSSDIWKEYQEKNKTQGKEHFSTKLNHFENDKEETSKHGMENSHSTVKE
jgi:hypothetical protein